jgi:hypothetical protein
MRALVTGGAGFISRRVHVWRSVTPSDGRFTGKMRQSCQGVEDPGATLCATVRGSLRWLRNILAKKNPNRRRKNLDRPLMS